MKAIGEENQYKILLIIIIIFLLAEEPWRAS